MSAAWFIREYICVFWQQFLQLVFFIRRQLIVHRERCIRCCVVAIWLVNSPSSTLSSTCTIAVINFTVSGLPFSVSSMFHGVFFLSWNFLNMLIWNLVGFSLRDITKLVSEIFFRILYGPSCLAVCLQLVVGNITMTSSFTSRERTVECLSNWCLYLSWLTSALSWASCKVRSIQQ